MKYFSFLFLSLTLVFSVAAQKRSGCDRILFTSADLNLTNCDSRIKRVSVAIFSKTLIVKYQNKAKVHIPEDTIWGIQHKNSYPYRLYNGSYYKLYNVSPVYRYTKKVGRSINEFFSVTPDSEIYSFTSEQLRKHVDSVTYSKVANENNRNIHEVAIDVFLSNTIQISHSVTRGGISIKHYPVKKFAGGLYLTFSQSLLKDTFGFSIGQPVVATREIGLLGQFDFIQQNTIRAGITLINGIWLMDLRDKSIRQRVETRHGTRYVSKEVATNVFYVVQPGLDLSYRLISNHHNPDFFLSGKMNYRFAVGNADFGSVSHAGGWEFGIGLSMIGFNKEFF